MHKLRDSNYGHPLGAPSKGKVSEMLPAFLTMTMHCNQDRAQNPSEHLKGYGAVHKRRRQGLGGEGSAN